MLKYGTDIDINESSNFDFIIDVALGEESKDVLITAGTAKSKTDGSIKGVLLFEDQSVLDGDANAGVLISMRTLESIETLEKALRRVKQDFLKAQETGKFV